MRKKMIGICDEETDYAKALMNAINSRTNTSLILEVFTDVKSLEEAIAVSAIEVLLISPAFYSESVETAADRKAIPIIILDNGKKSVGGDLQKPRILKYQSAEKIERKIMEELKDAGIGNPDQSGEAEIIAIYSPIHRIGKTSFALALGQELCKKQRVLFIDMEEFSVIPALLNENYETDLTEVLYTACQEGDLLQMKLPMFVRNLNGMDYIPPARIPLQLMEPVHEMGSAWREDWHEFIQKIAATGLYDTLVLDVGDSIRGILELLGSCSRLYIPVKEDPVSQGKLQQFMDMVEQVGYTEILEKGIVINMPEYQEEQRKSSYLGELLWESGSGIARTIVKEEEYVYSR